MTMAITVIIYMITLPIPSLVNEQGALTV